MSLESHMAILPKSKKKYSGGNSKSYKGGNDLDISH